MIKNYYKLNKVVAPITAAFPDVLSFLEQISVASGPWHTAMDLMTDSSLSLPHKRFRNSAHSHHVEQITACVYNCVPGLW